MGICAVKVCIGKFFSNHRGKESNNVEGSLLILELHDELSIYILANQLNAFSRGPCYQHHHPSNTQRKCSVQRGHTFFLLFGSVPVWLVEMGI